MTRPSPATRVIIPLDPDRTWSCIGSASIEVDAHSGMRLLRLDLCAMAARVYVPLSDIHALDLSLEGPPTEEAPGPRPSLPLECLPVAGHA